MRTQIGLAVLAVVLVAGCGRQDDVAAVKSASTQQAKAGISAADLAPAPQQRMRFVSPEEQSQRHVSMSAHGTKPVVMEQSPSAKPSPSSAALSMLASTRPAAVTVADAAQEQPSEIMPMRMAAPEPTRLVGGPTGEAEFIDQARDVHGPREGTGGNVVIRGGFPGTGKCDPRTDTHTTPREIGRPDFSMPLVPTRSGLGNGRRF